PRNQAVGRVARQRGTASRLHERRIELLKERGEVVQLAPAFRADITGEQLLILRPGPPNGDLQLGIRSRAAAGGLEIAAAGRDAQRREVRELPVGYGDLRDELRSQLALHARRAGASFRETKHAEARLKKQHLLGSRSRIDARLEPRRVPAE